MGKFGNLIPYSLVEANPMLTPVYDALEADDARAWSMLVGLPALIFYRTSEGFERTHQGWLHAVKAHVAVAEPGQILAWFGELPRDQVRNPVREKKAAVFRYVHASASWVCQVLAWRHRVLIVGTHDQRPLWKIMLKEDVG